MMAASVHSQYPIRRVGYHIKLLHNKVFWYAPVAGNIYLRWIFFIVKSFDCHYILINSSFNIRLIDRIIYLINIKNVVPLLNFDVYGNVLRNFLNLLGNKRPTLTIYLYFLRSIEIMLQKYRRTGYWSTVHFNFCQRTTR